MGSNVTPEQLVLTYLRSEGADVADADVANRGYHVCVELGMSGPAKVCIANSHALLIVAAIRIGFTFKARGKLAPACEYKGRAAIGGTEAEPTSSDPWWCLVNFVEAAQ